MTFFLWKHSSHMHEFVEMKPSQPCEGGKYPAEEGGGGGVGNEITSCFSLNVSVAGSKRFLNFF